MRRGVSVVAVLACSSPSSLKIMTQKDFCRGYRTETTSASSSHRPQSEMTPLTDLTTQSQTSPTVAKGHERSPLMSRHRHHAQNTHQYVTLQQKATAVKRRNGDDSRSLLAPAQSAAAAAVEMKALVDDMKSQLEEDGEEGALSSNGRSLREERRAYRAQLREQIITDVSGLSTLLSHGNMDKAARLLATMQTDYSSSSSPSSSSSSNDVPNSSAFAASVSAEVKGHLLRSIDDLADASDVHSLEVLAQWLKPSSQLSSQSSFLPLPILLPSHQQRLYCRAVDALLEAIAEDEYNGNTHIRDAATTGEGDSGVAVAGMEGYHQRRVAILAEAAEALPLQVSRSTATTSATISSPSATAAIESDDACVRANRAWLDRHYRGIPYSLIDDSAASSGSKRNAPAPANACSNKHPNVKRIEDQLYRRHLQADTDAVDATVPPPAAPLSPSDSVSTMLPPPSSSSSSSSSSSLLLVNASRQQLEAIVGRYERSLSSALRLLVGGGGKRGKASVMSAASSASSSSSSLSAVSAPHVARLRQLHLQTIGQPLVALLYLRDYKRAQRLMALVCGGDRYEEGGEGSAMKPSPQSLQYQRNKQIAQAAALSALLNDAAKTAQRDLAARSTRTMNGSVSTAAAECEAQLLHRIFKSGGSGGGRVFRSRAAAATEAASLIRLITGKSPQHLGHHLHLAFLGETAKVNRTTTANEKSLQSASTKTTMTSQQRGKKETQTKESLTITLPAMHTDPIVSAHFTATLKALTQQRRDSVAVLNLLFASSIALGNVRPKWATDRSLVAVVVSATCRELEREREEASGGARNNSLSSSSSPSSSSSLSNFLFADRNAQRLVAIRRQQTLSSIFNPIPLNNQHATDKSSDGEMMASRSVGKQTSLLREAFVPPNLPSTQSSAANSNNTATVRHHTTLKGFAQHLLTCPERFPLLTDEQRVALMASLLNSGNKVGIVRKALDALSLEDEKKRGGGLVNGGGVLQQQQNDDEKSIGKTPSETQRRLSIAPPPPLPPSAALESLTAPAARLAMRRRWLWDMAWLLSSHSWKRVNNDQSSNGKVGSAAPTDTKKGSLSSPLPVPPPAAAIEPTNVGIATLWRMLNDQQDAKRNEMERAQLSSAPSTSSSTSSPSPSSSSSSSSSVAAVSLLARLLLADPQAQFMEQHVKKSFWDSREGLNYDSSSSSAADKRGRAPTGENIDGQTASVEEDETNSASSLPTSVAPAGGDGGAVSPRREAFMALSSLLEDDALFAAVVMTCLEHQSTEASVKDRCEKLLRAEGML